MLLQVRQSGCRNYPKHGLWPRSARSSSPRQRHVQVMLQQHPKEKEEEGQADHLKDGSRQKMHAPVPEWPRSESTSSNSPDGGRVSRRVGADKLGTLKSDRKNWGQPTKDPIPVLRVNLKCSVAVDATRGSSDPFRTTHNTLLLLSSPFGHTANGYL